MLDFENDTNFMKAQYLSLIVFVLISSVYGYRRFLEVEYLVISIITTVILYFYLHSLYFGYIKEVIIDVNFIKIVGRNKEFQLKKGDVKKVTPNIGTLGLIGGLKRNSIKVIFKHKHFFGRALYLRDLTDKNSNNSDALTEIFKQYM